MSSNYFGVSGTHPALRYEFINNFNILGELWQYSKSNKVILDSLDISLHDKLIETVAGSVKETSSRLKGNNFNHFRPRFFLLIPSKWRGTTPGPLGFKEFTLEKAENTTALESLLKLCEKMEYKIFSSPMGDIYMEPSLHDLHPLDFWDNIEDRSILKKDDGPIGKQY